jgi:hypothetical protein
MHIALLLQLVIGDRTDQFQADFEEVNCMNPSSFANNGFSFMAYWPADKRTEVWYVTSPYHACVVSGPPIACMLSLVLFFRPPSDIPLHLMYELELFAARYHKRAMATVLSNRVGTRMTNHGHINIA